MNKDRVKGEVNQVVGKLKEATGRAVGDKRLEQKGRNQKIIGAVQKGLDDIKQEFRGPSKNRHGGA